MQYKDISLSIARAVDREMPGKFKSIRKMIADDGEKPQLVAKMAGTQTIMLSVYTDKAQPGSDSLAYSLCVDAVNVLIDPTTAIDEMIQSIDLQSTPDLVNDADRNAWQAWCYLDVTHLYSGG